MSGAILLALADDARLDLGEAGDARIEGARASIAIRTPPGPIRAALRALAAGARARDLEAMAGAEAARLHYYLDALARRGLLKWTAVDRGAPIATLRPTPPHFVPGAARLDEGRIYRLSRFAHARRAGEELLVECPLGHATVSLHDARAAALFFEAARPAPPRDLAARAGGLDPEAARALLQLLADAAALTAEPEGGPTEAALASWEFHDLLFHTRSRVGRSPNPMGATYRLEGVIPPAPVVKPPRGGAFIELDRPDIDALRRTDPPLAEVMERRRSVRTPPASTITARELGELLFRCARVRRILPAARLGGEDAAPFTHEEVSDRPYPGGGSCYELELYPIVRRCEGVAPGLHHYDPSEHRLEAVAGETAEVRELLRLGRPWGSDEEPQVLIVIAARFQRVSWRYEGVAYSLVLRHAGVLYQTLYLAATAMGLSPCGIGRGNSDLFARAARLDYYAETSVGEFAIGGRAPE